MTNKEFIEILYKQMAYDHGCADSGVNDLVALDEALDYWISNANGSREAMTMWLRSFTDPPYTYEDVIAAVKWLEDRGFDC